MDYLEIARIVKPHGLKGEVGVLTHWDESEAMLSVKSLRLQLTDGSEADYTLQSAKRAGRGFIVKLARVDDRDAAEALRGATVLVPRSELPAAGPGEAYLTDLVGRAVYGPDATHLGTVVEILTYPSVDSVVIEGADGTRSEQPLVDDWVEPLDRYPDRIVLRSLDGLLSS